MVSMSRRPSRAAMLLYGFTTDGARTFPIVPPFVSFVALAQNIYSAIMIFLFLLGLRNMLKLK